MSIFATPQRNESTNDYGVKVLFLHGLEGSSFVKDLKEKRWAKPVVSVWIQNKAPKKVSLTTTRVLLQTLITQMSRVQGLAL